MLQILNKNYHKILKKLPQEINKTILKAGLLLALTAYWGVIFIGTFLQLN